MRFLRQMPVMRALLVAFVVLFVFGVGGTSEVFGRTHMQNGHEGDPGDGYSIFDGDIISGGGGSGDFEIINVAIEQKEGVWSSELVFGFLNGKIMITPVFENEKVSWVFYIVLPEGGGK